MKEVDTPWQLYAGPFFLLCTLILATSPGSMESLYLGLAALGGLFLCIRYRMRGFVYASLMMGLLALAKYGFTPSYGLWQFGLEGSVACGLLITAIAVEERKSIFHALQELMKTRESAIANLEEDLSKVRESSLSERMGMQEKVGELQKKIEEGEAEHGSVLILNEVLRKTSASQTVELEQLAESGLDKERRIGGLLTEINDLQKELARVSNLSGLKAENDQLHQEANAARMEKAQVNLINENLVRLHAKEAQKFHEISERFQSLTVEKQKAQENFGSAKAEIQILSTHLQHVSEELEKAVVSLKQQEKVQMEKLFLQERLQVAEKSLASQTERVESLSSADELLHKVAEKEAELVQLEEKLRGVGQVEAMYKQLKFQFEEKNAVLHETRAQLFLVDTELQKLMREKEQAVLAAEPLSPHVQEEITALEEELHQLKIENNHLQEIIAQLSKAQK